MSRGIPCRQMQPHSEHDQRIKHSDVVVARALLLHSRGYGPQEVRLHLLDEGHDVCIPTLYNWLYSGRRV